MNKSFKKDLLREAHRRIYEIKDAHLEKKAMAFQAGKAHLKNSNSVRYRVMPAGRLKIEDIRDNISKNFDHYLRDRIQQGGTRETKLTTISPGVGTPVTPQEIRVQQDLRTGQETSIFDLQTTEPLFQADTIIPAFDEGFQPGHLYFRYIYERGIIPTRYPQHYNRAMPLLYELANIVDTDKQNIAQFMARLRFAGIALQPFCHKQYSQSKADKSAINNDLAKLFVASIFSGQKQFISSAYGQKALLQHIPLEDIENISVPQSSHPRVLYKNSDIDLFDTTEIPSELNRQLFWKIVCGFTLDKKKLHDTIFNQYLPKYAKMFSLPDKSHFLRRLHGHWEQTERLLVSLFRTIERRSPDEFRRAIKAWRQEEYLEQVADPIEMYGEEDYTVERDSSGKLVRKKGLQYRHGIPFFGANEGARCYITPEKGKECINISSLHMKMLLLSCTVDTKGLPPEKDNFRRSEVKIRLKNGRIVTRNATSWTPLPSADEYIEPYLTVYTIPDGMSDSHNFSLAKRGQKEIGLPPLIKVMQNDVPIVQLDRHNCNLGRKHLVKSGNGVYHLLKWSGQNAWIKTAMQKLDAAYRSKKMSPEFAEVYRILSTGTFGSEAFASTLDRFGGSIDVFQKHHLESGLADDPDDKISDPFPVKDGLPLLKEYGREVSAFMDFLYALMHRASKDAISIYHNDQQIQITSYGQRYSGSSGAGGGGEIMLSIKFAYSAKMEQIGGEEAIKQYQETRSEMGHDPRIRKKDPWMRATDPRNLGQDPLQQPMVPLPGAVTDIVRPHVIEKLSFWIGQSSTILGQGQRRPYMKTLWPQSKDEGSDWNAALNYFYLRNPYLAEDTGEQIFSMNMDLQKFQNRVSEAVSQVRRQLQLTNEIKVSTEFGTEIIGESEYQPEITERELTETTPEPVPVRVQEEVPPLALEPLQPTQKTFPPSQKFPTVPGFTPQPGLGTPTQSQPQDVYIRKPESKKKLFKDKTIRQMSVIDKLVKLADKLDRRHIPQLASKIDELLKVLNKNTIIK